MKNLPKKFAQILLLLTLLWPLIHLYLTTHNSFSPWRYGGWGMYSIPHTDLFSSLRIFACENNSQLICKKSVQAELVNLDSLEEEAPFFEFYNLGRNSLLRVKNIPNLVFPLVSQVLQLYRYQDLKQIIQSTLPLWEQQFSISLKNEKNPLMVLMTHQRLDFKKGQLVTKYSYFFWDERKSKITWQEF